MAPFAILHFVIHNTTVSLTDYYHYQGPKIIIQISMINGVCNNCQSRMFMPRRIVSIYAWENKTTKGIEWRTSLLLIEWQHSQKHFLCFSSAMVIFRAFHNLAQVPVDCVESPLRSQPCQLEERVHKQAWGHPPFLIQCFIHLLSGGDRKPTGKQQPVGL